MKTKEELYQQCIEHIHKRLETIEATIASNQKALQSETKSSAGDKHETGRAMLQLEMEKTGQQLQSIQQMKEVVQRIDVSKTSNIVHLGSVVVTNKANYFISVSAGQLKANNELYFAISTSSPIGKLFLGKQEGDTAVFNGNQIKISRIF